MLKLYGKTQKTSGCRISKRAVVAGCASGLLVSGPLRAAAPPFDPLVGPPSSAITAVATQAKPSNPDQDAGLSMNGELKLDDIVVAPTVSSDRGAEIPTKGLEFFTEFKLNPMPASEGLSVPELEKPARAYSDLLWSKDDYLAWIKGTGYQASSQTDSLSSVFPVSFLTEPVSPPPGAMTQWRLGERNWGYAADNGFAMRVGNAEIGSSVLAGTATLGGLHIRQSALAQPGDAKSWTVSMAFGALDYSSGTDGGDLAYGPTAANTVINYGLNEQLALESGVQVAPDLVTTSLGGRFDTRHFGQLRAGVAHGSQADQQGWRYQAAYDVQLADDLNLSVLNEWNNPGFADLGHYRDGVAPGIRQHWKATIPTQRWGDISGTYESFRPSTGSATQRFGFSQQFWYSPNLRIGLQAQREVDSGDYDIGIRFSVPIN